MMNQNSCYAERPCASYEAGVGRNLDLGLGLSHSATAVICIFGLLHEVWKLSEMVCSVSVYISLTSSPF